MDTFNAFITLVTIVVTIVPAIVIAAWLRNDLVRAGRLVATVIAIPFNGAGRVARAAGVAAREQARDTAHNLTAQGEIPAWSAFTVPLVLAAATLLFFTAEIWLAFLGWAALNHEDAPQFMAGKTSIFGAIAGMSAVIVWGITAMEIRNPDMPGPYRTMPLARLQRRETIAWACAVFSLALTATFYGWREGQIIAGANGAHEDLRSALAVGLIIGFGVFIGGAGVISGWSLLHAIGILIMAAVAILGWFCVLMEEVCRGTVKLIDGLNALLVALLDLVAGRGRSLWNWLVSFERIGARMHFSPIAFDERAAVSPEF